MASLTAGRVKAAMTQHGTSARSLSYRARIPLVRMALILCAQVEPSKTELSAIGETLDVSPDWLAGLTTRPNVRR